MITIEVEDRGRFDMLVVGTEHHAQQLATAIGTQAELITSAVMTPDDANPHDRGNAIAVAIDGVRVGFLSAYRAKNFRARKPAWWPDGQPDSADWAVTCPALVRREPAGVEVYLDIPRRYLSDPAFDQPAGN